MNMDVTIMSGESKVTDGIISEWATGIYGNLKKHPTFIRIGNAGVESIISIDLVFSME